MIKDRITCPFKYNLIIRKLYELVITNTFIYKMRSYKSITIYIYMNIAFLQLNIKNLPKLIRNYKQKTKISINEKPLYLIKTEDKDQVYYFKKFLIKNI